ncbi:hypothetical protein ABD68_24335 [Bacillus endophyticus]|uniref:glycosyltransferase family 4 protein n=1 Tax=Priestia endophytica TaxID=135735 RepID=UPI0018CD648C|nr:glycosyltransferase [Priestia endophytica]MBG9814567.1 hypothetical protein [Priestia endophytica]
MTLFIGPVGDNGGPAIKNRLLIKYLDRKSNFKICNTHNRTLSNFLKCIFTLIFSNDKQIIVAVSKNGRSFLYPILNIKKKLNRNLHYSTICIGGTIVQDTLENPKRIGNALSYADTVTVETRKLKRELEEKFNLSNVHYMPNYKEIKDNINNIQHFHEEELRFVFLSSVRNVKGVGTMIDVFKNIIQIYPKATLDIYGPIRKDFDMNILDGIKHISQINYKGVVPNNEVVETLSRYNIFLFPTEYPGEGFPAVLVEAYLAGLIVIASDMNFNSEIVKHEVNGWIFPTGNKDVFKKTILKCFNNVEVLDCISKTNKERTKEFDVECVIKDYRDKLRKMEWNI